jgi:hypothetical protein
MATRTAWLPRTALSLTLYNEFKNGILEPLNQNIQAFFNTQNDTFELKDVFKGDRLDISEPTICIAMQHQYNRGAVSNDAFCYEYVCSMSLKVPSFNDNTPEDFETIGNLFIDTITDYFINTNRINIVPVNSEGLNTLPGESTFLLVVPQDMLPTWTRDAAGQTNYRKFEVLVHAKFVIGLARENQL